MNLNTANALERFIRSIPLAVCRCSLAERDSGHHVDCRYEEVDEKVEALIYAINTDETLIT
jgi:hypothetical protein